MPQLRQNHTREKRAFLTMSIRVTLMFMFIVAVFALYWINTRNELPVDSPIASALDTGPSSVLVPGNNTYEVVEHSYYTLGYDEKNEQAAWVSYLLRKSDLLAPNVERSDRFEIDPLVKTGSADYYDYSGSGYSRGHWAPAGDMAFSESAMSASFFMSNMSPQKRSFNGGIWRELEELTRDWAFKREELYIVTGPILSSVDRFIGKKNKVGVPKYYYKAMLNATTDPLASIAFVMPNEMSEASVGQFAMTVDSLESILGLDLFTGILSIEEETHVESLIDLTLWPLNERKRELRITHWNKQ